MTHDGSSWVIGFASSGLIEFVIRDPKTGTTLTMAMDRGGAVALLDRLTAVIAMSKEATK